MVPSGAAPGERAVRKGAVGAETGRKIWRGFCNLALPGLGVAMASKSPATLVKRESLLNVCQTVNLRRPERARNEGTTGHQHSNPNGSKTHQSDPDRLNVN